MKSCSAALHMACSVFGKVHVSIALPVRPARRAVLERDYSYGGVVASRRFARSQYAGRVVKCDDTRADTARRPGLMAEACRTAAR